jgi:hypothetical protein
MEDRAERGRGFWLLLHVGRYWYVDDGREVECTVGKGRSSFLAPSADSADPLAFDSSKAKDVVIANVPQDVVVVKVSIGVENGAVSERLLKESPTN